MSNFEVPVIQFFENMTFGKSTSEATIRLSDVMWEHFRDIFEHSLGVLEVFGGVPHVSGGVPDVSGRFQDDSRDVRMICPIVV